MDHIQIQGWVAMGGLAFTVFGNVVWAAWRGGRIHERMSGHHDRLQTLEAKEAARVAADQGIAASLSGIQATLAGMNTAIGEINNRLHGH